MGGIHTWSVALASRRGGRTRWLAENGQLTADPRQALRLVSAEVAARRVHTFLELHGWPVEVLERFRLVSSPPLGAVTPLRSSGRPPAGDEAAAAA